MGRIAVCTSFYEAGRRFLPDFLKAFDNGRKSSGHDVVLVAAVDDLHDAEFTVGSGRPVSLIDTEPGSTVADVRSAMLRGGLASSADILVFADMDDCIAPGAIDAHVTALSEADISYGDLQPMDIAGDDFGPSFFEGIGVPERFEGVEAVSARNFLGFSNCAIRRASIPAEAMRIPSSLVACDWWFFSRVLLAGAKASRSDSVVTRYRIHGQNTLGARPDPSVASVLRRCRIVREHYAALPRHKAFDGRVESVRNLERRIETSVDAMRTEIAAACAKPGAWFEDIARLTAGIRPEGGA